MLFNYNYKFMPINIGLFHVGEAIKDRMKVLKMTQADFALILNMTQPSVNAMLRKSSMDTDLLKRISVHLDYNFFEDFCPDLKNNKKYITEEDNKKIEGNISKEFAFILKERDEYRDECARLKLLLEQHGIKEKRA